MNRASLRWPIEEAIAAARSFAEKVVGKPQQEIENAATFLLQDFFHRELSTLRENARGKIEFDMGPKRIDLQNGSMLTARGVFQVACEIDVARDMVEKHGQNSVETVFREDIENTILGQIFHHKYPRTETLKSADSEVRS